MTKATKRNPAELDIDEFEALAHHMTKVSDAHEALRASSEIIYGLDLLTDAIRAIEQYHGLNLPA